MKQMHTEVLSGSGNQGNTPVLFPFICLLEHSAKHLIDVHIYSMKKCVN